MAIILLFPEWRSRHRGVYGGRGNCLQGQKVFVFHLTSPPNLTFPPNLTSPPNLSSPHNLTFPHNLTSTSHPILKQQALLGGVS